MCIHQKFWLKVPILMLVNIIYFIGVYFAAKPGNMQQFLSSIYDRDRDHFFDPSSFVVLQVPPFIV